MTDRLARLVGALGCLCLELSEWLSPLKVEPPSVEAIMHAVEKDSWRVTSMAQPEAAARCSWWSSISGLSISPPHGPC